MNEERRSGIPTGRKVAIIGMGRAGLECSNILAQKGHQVAVFKSKPVPDGLLVYEIQPTKGRGEFERAGMNFVPSTGVGKDKTIDGLFEDGFDAVFIDVGSEVGTKMENTPGTDLSGVYEATDFLIRANTGPIRPSETVRKPLEIGRRVVVIGGDEPASDCLRTVLRFGSEDVTCLCQYAENEMPVSKKGGKMEREEGAKYRFLTQPIKFIAGSDGRLAAVECVELKPGEPDSQGYRKTVPVEGSNFSVAADTAIISWGAVPVQDKALGTTSREGVFTVEDQGLVATVTAGGEKAALAIDEYLKNKK
jgi:glutamate synthase (NADPH/NADH) small chain